MTSFDEDHYVKHKSFFVEGFDNSSVDLHITETGRRKDWVLILRITTPDFQKEYRLKNRLGGFMFV
jgi:hypothetical protein